MTVLVSIIASDWYHAAGLSQPQAFTFLRGPEGRVQSLTFGERSFYCFSPTQPWLLNGAD